jgi:DNA-binding Lrp family transcriptional regulator
MKHSTCFDIAVLEYGVKNKILKPLALFYSVKAKYRHSIIYNYTPRKLAKLTKLHPKTIERYVKKLESHGFIKHRDGHLLFISRHKLDLSKGWRHIQTIPWTSFEGILNRMYFVILINNKTQQQYKIACNYENKLGVVNPHLRKKAIRNYSSKERGLENSSIPILSVTSATRLFNTSRNKAHSILKALQRNNYLSFKPIINDLGKARGLKYLQKQGLLGHFFNRHGHLYQYLGREITVGGYSPIT